MSSSAERRARILAAAERLFRHYGPAKTTINDIAREVGIGVGSVYLEFCSKTDIIAELSRQRRSSIVLAMRSACAAGTYGERLSAALEARVDALFTLSAQGAHSCDLVLCSGPSRAAQPIFHEEEVAFVEELLRGGIDAGEFGTFDVTWMAALIQRAYMSFSPPWLFEQDRREVLSLVRDMNRLLLDGLRARPRESRPRR